jgi:hypothetical protein
MKVVVFDDGGLIGVETALWVRDHGHEVGIVSAPAGFEALTRKKVADALHGCAAVIDLVHQPPPATGTFPSENGPAGGLLRAAIAAGVRHHVMDSGSVAGVRS